MGRIPRGSAQRDHLPRHGTGAAPGGAERFDAGVLVSATGDTLVPGALAATPSGVSIVDGLAAGVARPVALRDQQVVRASVGVGVGPEDGADSPAVHSPDRRMYATEPERGPVAPGQPRASWVV